MDIFEGLIFGIVEGITEFFPISSTGHLIILGHLLTVPNSDFLKSFEIVIQSGAILSVIVFYFRQFFNIGILTRIISAFVPTAILGLIFYGIIKKYFLGNTMIVLASLLIGGIIIIIFEKKFARISKTRQSSEISNISIKQSIYLGFIQCISFIPGVSRSGATIIGGLSLGIDRKAITEFSFLLAVPTMMAATGLDLIKNYQTILDGNLTVLLIGFVSAFVVSMFSIKFLLSFVSKYSFIPFGVYRIISAIVFYFILF